MRLGASTTSSKAEDWNRSTVDWASSGSAIMARISGGLRLDVTMVEACRWRSTLVRRAWELSRAFPASGLFSHPDVDHFDKMPGSPLEADQRPCTTLMTQYAHVRSTASVCIVVRSRVRDEFELGVQ